MAGRFNAPNAGLKIHEANGCIGAAANKYEGGDCLPAVKLVSAGLIDSPSEEIAGVPC